MISIIIPAYNREKYIEQCVHSALCQTYKNIEIIIVDDGSADSTGAICDTLAEADRRIRVIHQVNGGVSAARQAGIDSAQGQWICFLDSDDSLPENALATYSKSFSENPDIIISHHSGELDTRQFLLGLTNYTIPPTLCAKIFKADFLKKNMPKLPRELVVGEDLIANLVLGLNAGKIATIADRLYNVTLDNSTSVMNTFKKSFDYENYFFEMLDALFISQCSNLPYHQELLKNSVFMKLNGYKNVVLCGNSIDTTSSQWLDFLSKVKETNLELHLSDRLFLKMQNHQKAYRVLMNDYLNLKKLFSKNT